MSATVHILCDPAGSAYTARLLGAAAPPRPTSATPSGSAPTRRAVEAVRESLLDGPSLLAPRLFTFQDFAEEVIPRQRPGGAAAVGRAAPPAR